MYGLGKKEFTISSPYFFQKHLENQGAYAERSFN